MLSFALQSRSMPTHGLTQISTDMRKESVSHLCSSVAKFCYLLSCEGPAGAFFLLSAFTPNFFQNRIRYGDTIVRHVFRMRVVQGEVERRERELAPIKNTGVGKLGVVHFFDDFGRNLFRRVAVISREGVEHFLVPDPVLQHLRWRFDEIT